MVFGCWCGMFDTSDSSPWCYTYNYKYVHLYPGLGSCHHTYKYIFTRGAVPLLSYTNFFPAYGAATLIYRYTFVSVELELDPICKYIYIHICMNDKWGSTPYIGIDLYVDIYLYL